MNELTATRQLIATGDDQELYDMVYADEPGGQVKNELMAASPYLSDDVMITALEDKPTPLPNGHVKQVIEANSPVTDPVYDAVLGNTRNAYMAATDAYIQLTDGGNTLYTLNRIESIQESNKNEIITELNTYDRLSEVSINAFLEKDITGLVIKRKNLLMKNSPLPGSSQSLLSGYDLPNPHLQDLLGAQTGPSIVEQEMNEIGSLEAAYQEAKDELIRVISKTDSLYSLLDTVIILLEADTNLTTRLQLIPLYLWQQRLDDALVAIAQAEVQKDRLWSEEQRTNVEEKLVLAQLAANMLQPGADRQAITEANAATLFSIAENDITKESVTASLLLQDAGLMQYNPLVALPEEDLAAKSLLMTVEETADDDDVVLKEEPVFNIYPNPNDGSMWIQYTIAAPGEVVLYGISGNEISRHPLTPESNYYLLKQKTLETGVYLYRIFEQGRVVHYGKFVVLNK
ncbi:MAG: T9SS type A sorting domain-containing protein [Bacteroidetes bacterium]|nr:T9SS type A sorting domain-containing protein [Bacteroidota bacterium]